MVAICQTDARIIRMIGRKFFLGDPCFAFPDDKRWFWEEVCDYMRDNGGFDKDHCVPVGNHHIVVFPTGRGDGVYFGSDGRTYGVDSGALGLVPLELVAWMHGENADMAAVAGRLERFGRIIGDSARDAIIPCTNQGGDMTFGEISINTGG